MKKYSIVFLVMAAMLTQSCRDNDLLYDFDGSPVGSQTIEFSNYVSGITRASRTPGNSFVLNDEMQVYGFQTADGVTSQIFVDQLVKNIGSGKWSYTPKKYWSNGSAYDFYAIFPYDAVNNSFDNTDRKFSVNDFTVADVTDDQVDLMIAQRIENRISQNTVNFEFNHILSNVNFYIKAATTFDTEGIGSIKVLEFDVTGLYSKGSFAQSGWNGSNVFEGTWTADNASVYNMPQVTNVVYTVGNPREPLVEDLLLLPQTINDNAEVYVRYMLNYADGAQTIFKRTVGLNKIMGAKKSTPEAKITLNKWDPNYRYNYTIALDPSKNENAGDTIPTDPTDPDYPATPFVDYDGGLGEYQTPDAYLVKDANGDFRIDTDNDGNGDIKILWKDIDGDGMLEGVADKNGDGILDATDTYDGDGKDYNDNLNDFDVIMVDTNNDGYAESELERPIPDDLIDDEIPTDPDDPNYPATPFIDYNGGVDGYKTPGAYLVEDANGDFWIDLNGNGIFDAEDIKVLWEDIDGDGKLEGVADKDGDGILTVNDTYDNDNLDYNGNPNAYDVIMVDKDGDGTAETELEKDQPLDPVVPVFENVIEFSAEVTNWNDEYEAEQVVY